MVESFPFQESKKLEGDIEKYVRTFKSSLDENDLKWHWDEEDRIINPTHETNWCFQLDNELPRELVGEIKIPKGLWHRLIKGSGDLELEIQKIKK